MTFSFSAKPLLKPDYIYETTSNFFYKSKAMSVKAFINSNTYGRLIRSS